MRLRFRPCRRGRLSSHGYFPGRASGCRSRNNEEEEESQERSRTGSASATRASGATRLSARPSARSSRSQPGFQPCQPSWDHWWRASPRGEHAPRDGGFLCSQRGCNRERAVLQLLASGRLPQPRLSFLSCVMDSSIHAKGTVQQDVYAASQRAYILLRVLLTSSQTRMCTPPHSEPTY